MLAVKNQIHISYVTLNDCRKRLQKSSLTSHSFRDFPPKIRLPLKIISAIYITDQMPCRTGNGATPRQKPQPAAPAFCPVSRGSGCLRKVASHQDTAAPGLSSGLGSPQAAASAVLGDKGAWGWGCHPGPPPNRVPVVSACPGGEGRPTGSTERHPDGQKAIGGQPAPPLQKKKNN